MILRDGSAIHIRPISVGDSADLATAVEKLSPESRYRRFFSVLKKLDARTIAYFTDVDHISHEALIALDPDHGELVGVARYICAHKAARPPRSQWRSPMDGTAEAWPRSCWPS